MKVSELKKLLETIPDDYRVIVIDTDIGWKLVNVKFNYSIISKEVWLEADYTEVEREDIL